MSTAESMISTALVGTARTKPVAPIGEVGTALAGYVPADAESALLAAAGTLDLWSRAGFPAPQRETNIEPAGVEALPVVNATAASLLAASLASRDEALVVEWIELCAAAKKIAAPETLPALLDFSVRKPAHSPLASSVGGKRAAWLIAQNPAWLAASTAAEWDAWETAARKERVALLKALRSADAVRARGMLEATWESEPANIRAEMLSQLRTGLGMADEPFLETALDDRSKEVRAASVELLARLPESRFVARMIERGEKLIAVEKGGLLRKTKLTLNTPETVGADLLRDGADAKVNVGQLKIGDKALALLHIFAAIPPARWTARFEMKPPDFLDLIAKTEWADAAVLGIAWAAARSADAAWTAALFERGIHVRPLPFPLHELAAALAEPQRAGVVDALVRDRSGSHADAVVDMMGLLECFERFWPPSLAETVLGRLRKAAKGAYQYHLAYAMRACFDRIPLSSAESAALGWPEDGEWRNTLVPLIDRLRFRIEMKDAISKP